MGGNRVVVTVATMTTAAAVVWGGDFMQKCHD
jgi:hypothetical protein